MSKQKIVKILSLSGLIVILFIGSTFGAYKYTQQKYFNNSVMSANQKLYAGDYNAAIELYNKALNYKNDNSIRQKMLLAQSYKQYQDIYNQGLKLMSDKKYLEAIQKFTVINQNSGQIYTNSQNKIEECKKNIISEDVQATNNAISNKDYDSANKYVEDILKLDSNNNNAKQLKSTIVQAQQKDKSATEQKQQTQNNIQNKVAESEDQNMLKKGQEHMIQVYRKKILDLTQLYNSIEEKERLLPHGSIEKNEYLKSEIRILQERNNVINEMNNYLKVIDNQ